MIHGYCIIVAILFLLARLFNVLAHSMVSVRTFNFFWGGSRVWEYAKNTFL